MLSQLARLRRPKPVKPEVAIAKQWSKWTSIEAAQLNWMRNALSATGVGLALIHFRREIDDAPPLGGLVLTTLGLGYSYAGSAVYLTAAWQLRAALGLTAASATSVVTHALVAPAALTTAALCFLDRPPRWLVLAADAAAERAVPGSAAALDRRRHAHERPSLPSFLAEPPPRPEGRGPPERPGEAAEPPRRPWWDPWRPSQ